MAGASRTISTLRSVWEAPILSPPTTYEYSQLRRQRRREAVPHRVRAEVDGRLPDPQDLDAVEQGARQ
jgi:hypothetical protein